ncbi:hypothetical protein K7G98_33355, partial [Saccharothrix sp. MB29]|nr:hypothetical protein [Saccharothrix sp. MB29]
MVPTAEPHPHPVPLDLLLEAVAPEVRAVEDEQAATAAAGVGDRVGDRQAQPAARFEHPADLGDGAR